MKVLITYFKTEKLIIITQHRDLHQIDESKTDTKQLLSSSKSKGNMTKELCKSRELVNESQGEGKEMSSVALTFSLLVKS